MPWLGDAGRISEYGVRFTRPVVVDPDDGAELRVVATIGELDAEAGTARVDLTVTAAATVVLGKAQVRVRLGGGPWPKSPPSGSPSSRRCAPAGSPSA